MSTISFSGKECHTSGELPDVGRVAPDVMLTKTDLTTTSFADHNGKAMLLNIYPSIDTQVCFDSVKQFESFAQQQKDIVIACISMDLPFALKRVLEGEGLQNILFLSDFRNRDFGELFGLTIVDGPLAGLLARAVVVLNEDHQVVYHELVQDVSTPPDYSAALEQLKQITD